MLTIFCCSGTYLDSILLWFPLTNLLFIYQYLWPFYAYMPTEPVIQRINIFYNKRIFLSLLLDPIGSQYIRAFVTHYVCFYVCLKKLRTRYNQISLTPLILSPPQNNIPRQEYKSTRVQEYKSTTRLQEYKSLRV